MNSNSAAQSRSEAKPLGAADPDPSPTRSVKRQTGWRALFPAIFYRLRVRLLFLVALALAPMLALFVYGALQDRSAAIREVHESAARLASLAASRQTQQVEHAKQLLSALGQMQRWGRASNIAATATLFQRLASETKAYGNIIAYDTNAQPLVSAQAVSNADGHPERQPWFYGLLKGEIGRAHV